MKYFSENERFEVIIAGSAFTCLIILAVILTILEVAR